MIEEDMNIRLISASILVLSLTLIIVTVEAYNPAYQIDAVNGSTPSIDGLIVVGEWDDASKVSFNDTTVYLKQDGKNLYVAFNVSDNTANLGQDAVAIFIDVENDGGSSPQPDDLLLGVLRGGQLFERQGSNPSGPPTGGWNASTSSANDIWHTEFNVTYAKVGVTFGEAKTLGIAFESWDYNAGFPCFYPPMTPMQSNYPSNWGNLHSEQNWIPEFQSFLLLPIFMIATLLAVTVHRRRSVIRPHFGTCEAEDAMDRRIANRHEI
jgi:hypothetical protein